MAPVARMLTARTAASASQLARARPVTAVQPAGESCSEPSRSAQARMVLRGSVAGRRSSRDPCCNVHAAGRSSPPRSRADARPLRARRSRKHAADGGGRDQDVPGRQPSAHHDQGRRSLCLTPPASSDQPASGASAPCRVKRRK